MSLEAEYACFSIELTTPLKTSRGEIESRDGFLIRLSDGEYTGYGEVTPLPPWTETHQETEKAVYRSLERLGSSDLDETRSRLPSYGTPAARYGVSLALADLRAKRQGLPLYAYLGDRDRPHVEVNATVGDIPKSEICEPSRPEESRYSYLDETVEEVRGYVEEGYETVKIKVGFRDVTEDAERLRRVAEEFDVTLRVDANGAWNHVEASVFADSVSDLDNFEYVEQPLDADDLSGHTSLRDEVDVALDESLIDHSVDEIIEEEVADYVVLKPMSVGGIGRAHEVGEYASENGVSPVVSNTVETVVGRSAAAHLAASLGIEEACGLATGSFLSRDLGDETVENGCIDLSDQPGNAEVNGVW